MGALDFLSPITGSKPQIADYQPIDLSAEQLKAITANIENFSQFAELGNLYQQYMLSQYESAIPGFRDILKMGGETTKQMLGTAGEWLAGKVPEEFAGEIQRSSAFQNLLSGGGGTMASANVARNYGLGVFQTAQMGAQLAGQAGNATQRWAALAQAGGPQGMMVTTQQQAQLDMQQNLIKQATQQTKYNVAAAPDPGWKHLSDIVYGLTAAYLGGGKGGGGGGLPAGNAAATGAASSGGYQFGGVSDVSQPGYTMSSGGGGGMDFGGGAPATAGTAYNPYGAGFGYGVGYPSSNPDLYYGNTSNISQQALWGQPGVDVSQGVPNNNSMYWTG